jgi:LysR family glycine cleavage system transcriptional activator
VFPVCSPGHLEQNGPINTPVNIVRQILLSLEDNHWDWMTWRVSLTENNVDLAAEHHGMTINHHPLVLQAATAGRSSGVSLG